MPSSVSQDGGPERAPDRYQPQDELSEDVLPLDVLPPGVQPPDPLLEEPRPWRRSDRERLEDRVRLWLALFVSSALLAALVLLSVMVVTGRTTHVEVLAPSVLPLVSLQFVILRYYFHRRKGP